MHVSVNKPQPKRMLFILLDAHSSAVENCIVNLLSDLLLQSLLDGKKGSRVLAAKTIEKILTEEAGDHRRIRIELLEWCCPTVAYQHGSMSWHEEKLFVTAPAPCDAIQRNLGLRKLNGRGFRVPSTRHPCSENQVNQSIGSIHWMTSLAQRVHNLATVQRDLKPLESKALAGTLRPHQNCEISEREIHVGEMREIPNFK
jgi:hypothetical protein